MSILVESSIMHKQPGIRPELEAALNANKSSFTQLLKNPPRNEADAALIRKSTTEGKQSNTGLSQDKYIVHPSPILLNSLKCDAVGLVITF